MLHTSYARLLCMSTFFTLNIGVYPTHWGLVLYIFFYHSHPACLIHKCSAVVPSGPLPVSVEFESTECFIQFPLTVSSYFAFQNILYHLILSDILWPIQLLPRYFICSDLFNWFSIFCHCTRIYKFHIKSVVNRYPSL